MTVSAGVAQRPRTGRASATARPGARLAGLAELNLRSIWSGFLAQSLGFWCISFYLFIDYVRPQQIYLQLAVVPWGKIALGSAVISVIVEGRFALREKLLWTLLSMFTAVILASSITAYNPSFAFENLDLWAIWFLAIVAVSGACRSRAEVILTFFLWCLWNFKMSQSAFRGWLADGFMFRSWGAVGAPGWFSNSGEFGIEMVMFFSIAAYFLIGLWPNLSKPRRVILGMVALSGVIAAIASSSRGALVGLAAIGFWILLRSKQRVKAGAAVLLLSALVWVVLPAESKKRFSESGEDDTSIKRIQYWKDGLQIAQSHPVLGIGYKNWIPYYKANYNPQGQLPHNIFIECVAELGYVGLMVFILLIGGTFRQNALTRKLTGKNARAPDRLAFFLAYGLDGALVGYLASGLFVTVLFFPFFWINLGFTIALSRYATSRGALQDPRPRRRLAA